MSSPASDSSPAAADSSAPVSEQRGPDAAARHVVSPGALRQRFSRVSSLRGAIDAIAYWLAIGVIFVVAHQAHHWAVYGAAIVLIGGLQHALITLQHDAWHRLSFRARRWNDLIGAWCYGYPVGMPFYHERRRHLAHHRHFGSPDRDPDWVSYSNEGRSPVQRLWRFFVGRLLGSLVFGQLVSVLLHRRPRVGAELAETTRGPSILTEYIRVAIWQLALLALFAWAGRWWEYFVLWIVPLGTTASLFVALRAFLEHAHPDDSVPAEERLYDFFPNWVERFFISPCHFNYHALHHAFPTIPHGNLPGAYRFAVEHGIRYPGQRREGYWRFLLHHAQRLPRHVATMSGRKSEPPRDTAETGAADE